MASAPALDRATDDLADGLRLAMRRLASGVAIITAKASDGPIGMAATSITSLSMDPPSLLICVNQRASLHACLSVGVRFGITLLSAGQQEIAAAFGSSAARAVRFTSGGWSVDADGVGSLAGSQANLACAVEQLIQYGTHTVVIGRVDGVTAAGEGAPLIYCDGRYL